MTENTEKTKRRITIYVDKATESVLQKHMEEACETNVTAMLCRMIRAYGGEGSVGSLKKRDDLEERVKFLEAVCRKLLMEKD